MEYFNELKEYKCYNTFIALYNKYPALKDDLTDLARQISEDFSVTVKKGGKIEISLDKNKITGIIKWNIDIGFCQWGYLTCIYPKGKYLLWFLKDKLVFTRNASQFTILYSK